MCDTEANFAEVRESAETVTTQPEVPAEIENGVDSKKTVLVVQKDASASASASVSDTFEQRCCGSVKVAVAYEFDSLGGSVGRTQARPIRVMESYQSPNLNISRRSPYKMLNAAFPTCCLIEALRSNQIKSNQIKSNQINSIQIKEKIKTNQIKSTNELFFIPF